ncbi:DUF3048 domain-containing protein [Streptomyces beihaiensis]|uniref:DUF3048 domain-containing protein n=1 Tax=Streptomyces beihaiensis TaxID=2984495 RepID=A0ABT3TNJ0_9ACTN|nr:DUF3048 domain-containing protein [Streptomyces beihaiensis]MCX3058599.1 DUF3048 domain-containing protein [Streptomyces beihaiensis]
MDGIRRRGFLAGCAAGLIALAAVACTGGGTGPDRGASPSPSPSSGAPGANVLAVKIDNVGAARPQTGLQDADIVYAEQVEGGLSRLMAVFGADRPAVVGPVRSARETDLELLRQFDRPTFAYSGAQHKLLPLIAAAPLRAVPPGKAADGAYFRGGDRPPPHNLYLRPRKLAGTAGGSGAGAAAGFRFAARVPAGGTPVTEETVRFPAARFGFVWSARRHRWLVSMDGHPATLTGGSRLAAATVVVQYVDVEPSRFHDKLGSTTPLSHTVGSGRALVLRDGRSFDARWDRRAATDGTTFTAADTGKPLPFAPGQVWVVLAAKQ